MQRLADRVYKEFAFTEQPIQIHALDGNGDMFEVFKGPVTSLTAYAFLPVLQDPGCFYFFAIACQSTEDDEIMRRDLCWLTDPLPPYLEVADETSLAVFWNEVTFCGVEAPYFLESVSYGIEIAEGVEWKDNMLSRYINDLTALEYREVCRITNETYFVINNLKPATWYHVRLVVHYLGFRVASEAASFHTLKSVPSPPGEPRVQIIPVKNSFDVVSDQPARLDLMITWTPSHANGSDVQRYQVHIKRFDHEGEVLYDDPPTLRKKALPEILNKDKAISKMVKLDRRSNQWTQSKGKSALQIQNSMTTRAQSPTRLRSKSPPHQRGSAELSALPSSPVGFRASTASSSASWRIVYDNLSRGVRMGSPCIGDGTWWIRVRAKNTLGWSDFGPITVLSRTSHPTLFSMPSSKRTITVRPPSRDGHQRLSASYADLPPSQPEDGDGPLHVINRQSLDQNSMRRSREGGGPEDPGMGLYAGYPMPGEAPLQRPASRPTNAMGGLESLPTIHR